MALICPVCNGLEELRAYCNHCYSLMNDKGLVQNYVGPYAPYEEYALMAMAEEQECVHIVTCSQCGYDTKVPIKLMNV